MTSHPKAATPPMGWNSYDCFGGLVTEDEVKANAEFMAKHLLPCGWEYVVIDISWQVPEYNADLTDWSFPLTLDEYGRPMPAENRFPSAVGGRGFKPISDYVHSLGLKFGIHIMRGLTTQAVDLNTPIFGTDLRAQDIVDRAGTCDWSPHAIGVDASKPGAREWYESLFAQYAEWGVDFIKVDDISHPYHKAEIELVRSAIEKCGREMVLSLSPGPAPIDEADHLKSNANMWRVSSDFWDRWDCLENAFDLAEKWAPHAGPGHWPDQDMLPFGRIGIRHHPLNSPDRQSRFTRDEHITLMSLWCMCRSPLMFGGHLPDTDEWTLALLTNEEVLRFHRDCHSNRQLYRRGDRIVWTASGNDGGTYLALFNTGEGESEISVELSELDLRGRVQVRDLWLRENLYIADGVLTVVVAPHGARLLSLVQTP